MSTPEATPAKGAESAKKAKTTAPAKKANESGTAKKTNASGTAKKAKASGTARKTKVSATATAAIVAETEKPPVTDVVEQALPSAPDHGALDPGAPDHGALDPGALDPGAPDIWEPSSFDPSDFQRDLSVNGASVRVVQLGVPGNPALVFVHGFMGSWRNWILNLPHFARDHHVIAIDLPGFGDSEMPVRGPDYDVYVDTVKAVCDQLLVKRATLVGNSMGGMVVTATAKRFPEFVERLVLMNGAGFTTAVGLPHRLRPLLALFERPLKWAYRFRHAIARNALLRAIGFCWLMAHPVRVGPVRALELLRGVGKPAYAPMLFHVTNDRIDLVPGTVKCPTLILWGRYDVLIPRLDAARYAKLCPNSSVEYIKSTGHLAMIEEPQIFNTRVRDFVARPLAEFSGMTAPTESAPAPN